METSLIGTLLAAGGLFFTGIAYLKGEEWKRAELARQLVERLSTDDELAFCTRALDWGVGPLIIPEKHRPLFPEGTRIMEHDPRVLAQAVEPALGPGWRKPESLTYRHSFDAFFTYLLRVADQVRSKHVSRDQLVGLDYYLQLVRNPPYLTRPDETDSRQLDSARQSTFRPFVNTYYKSLEPFVWQGPSLEEAGRADALPHDPEGQS